MRAIGLTDLDIATRAVMVSERPAFDAATALIEAAHSADKVRKRTGCPSPTGGTGSLYAQAALGPVAAASPNCSSYLAALTVLLNALEVWRHRADHNS